MSLAKLLPDAAPTLSFEFFPPKTDAGAQKLWESVEQLAAWNPEFVSVTCGAGGSAIDGTAAVVRHIRAHHNLDVAPHVAIARQSRSRVRAALKSYSEIGVRRVVAIRGDDAQGGTEDFGDDFYPNTIDFVGELSRDFGLEPFVAAYPDVHPRAESPKHDLEHLKRKIAAGATLAISQFFFQPETFLRFRDLIRKAGIDTPLAAGILPIQNCAQAIKFAHGCGTVVPSGFTDRFDRHGANQDAHFDEGVAHAVDLCDHLYREGVRHFHFYTLNRADMTQAICEKLAFGIQGSAIGKSAAGAARWPVNANSRPIT
jgi:methylenetetrahydrofolate reductase (NADPH)